MEPAAISFVMGIWSSPQSKLLARLTKNVLFTRGGCFDSNPARTGETPSSDSQFQLHRPRLPYAQRSSATPSSRRPRRKRRASREANHHRDHHDRCVRGGVADCPLDDWRDRREFKQHPIGYSDEIAIMEIWLYAGATIIAVLVAIWLLLRHRFPPDTR